MTILTYFLIPIDLGHRNANFRSQEWLFSW